MKQVDIVLGFIQLKKEPENNGEHLWQWTAQQSLYDEIKTPVENAIKNG